MFLILKRAIDNRTDKLFKNGKQAIAYFVIWVGHNLWGDFFFDNQYGDLKNQ